MGMQAQPLAQREESTADPFHRAAELLRVLRPEAVSAEGSAQIQVLLWRLKVICYHLPMTCTTAVRMVGGGSLLGL